MGTNTIYKSALVHNIVSTILAYSYALDYQESYLYDLFNKYSINKLRAIHEELQIYGVEAVLNKYVNY